jgi:O-6-methylguanine DNA methyltransferase
MTVQLTELKQLGSLKAPAGFAVRVLASAGVADSYALLDTVLGGVYVAWNRNGVSAAARYPSADEFEAWFRKDIGHPAAVRAVGTALANNPIPYFIPCHRVVRSDGVIGNYGGGGPEAKKQILGMEGVHVARLEELGRSGYRYEGVRTTKIFCYPTCHHARRAQDRNVVWLHDEAEARARGFRPCKVCRPAAA